MPLVQRLLFSESTVSAFGNWVPVKNFKRKEKKSQKRKWHQPGSPTVALSLDCLSERVWKKNYFGSVSFTAANGNFQECCSGQPGAVSTATFTRCRPGPGWLAGQLGDMMSSLSFALPLEVQFMFHRQRSSQVLPYGPLASSFRRGISVTSSQEAVHIHSCSEGETLPECLHFIKCMKALFWIKLEPSWDLRERDSLS